jgi:5-methylcytosine-specific restriction endonuclease McrBC GTP-binding regulatory subunit McrB
MPGCGKSYYIEHDILGKDKVTKEYVGSYSGERVIRTTFYQDYSNTDFVGQILPVVSDDDKVKYEFVPGPFTLALSKAIEKPEEKVALVIEEINRGNAAAIFGDLFQLLDRNDAGTSVYPLTNVQITDYLKKEFIYTLDYIKIPSNLSIYATMNTGDQNVFTLDTAFKRRWNFEKLSNKFNKSDAHSDRYIPGMSSVTWEKFVITINDHMIKEGTFDSEDKQLGKYFVTYNQLVDNGENDTAKAKKFAYKVLEYLWNDVAKFDRERWFNTSKYKTLDDVLAAWINGEGSKVFNSDIIFSGSTVVSAASAEEIGEEG